jgi:hypothetical protein
MAQFYLMVYTLGHDGWHTIVAALVRFTGIFLQPSLCQDIKYNCQLLFSLLAGLGQCPPRYGNNHVYQSIRPSQQHCTCINRAEAVLLPAATAVATGVSARLHDMM